jgi:hypothetical protein
LLVAIVRPTRHSPPHGDIADDDVAAAAAGRAVQLRGHQKTGGIERSAL